MTYCVGMLLDAGLVFLADSRTNAGVDQISTFRKMTVFEQPGERVMVLLTAGQSGDLAGAHQHPARAQRDARDGESIYTARRTCSRRRAQVGDALREVHRRDAEALQGSLTSSSTHR